MFPLSPDVYTFLERHWSVYKRLSKSFTLVKMLSFFLLGSSAHDVLCLSVRYLRALHSRSASESGSKMPFNNLTEAWEYVRRCWAGINFLSVGVSQADRDVSHFSSSIHTVRSDLSQLIHHHHHHGFLAEREPDRPSALCRRFRSICPVVRNIERDQ